MLHKTDQNGGGELTHAAGGGQGLSTDWPYGTKYRTWHQRQPRCSLGHLAHQSHAASWNSLAAAGEFTVTIARALAWEDDCTRTSTWKSHATAQR